MSAHASELTLSTDPLVLEPLHRELLAPRIGRVFISCTNASVIILKVLAV